MKRLFPAIAIVSIMIAGFTACTPSVPVDEEQLIGRWQNETNTQEYWVYTTETDETGDYQYGKTWDESEVEEDMIEYHGNGWFKWQVAGQELTQIHLMDNGAAEIPKVYTITLLNDNRLEYKDNFGKRFSFVKIAAQ